MKWEIEEAWHSPSDPFAWPPMPELFWSGSDPRPRMWNESGPLWTDEHYLACGYRKMRRRVTEWEPIEEDA